MVLPLHLGLEHPSLLWLVVVGIIAFVSGLGVNLYRSRRSVDTVEDATVADEPTE